MRPPRLHALAPSLALVAALALLGSACGDKGDDTGAGGEGGHPYAGNWGGSIAGHAAFEADWQETPYCTGNVTAVVQDNGLLYGTGSCAIDWGPYVGEVFAVELSGEVTEGGAVSLTANLDDDAGERSFDTASMEGTATGDSLEADGATLYNPAGMEAIEAEVVISLSR